jgi:hypothetical protein
VPPKPTAQILLHYVLIVSCALVIVAFIVIAFVVRS